MRSAVANGELKRLFPLTMLVGAMSLLTFAIFYHSSRAPLVAPLVLLVAVVATSYRQILRWDSLLAGVVLVVFFIPIKRYTLPSQLPFNLEPYRLMIAFVAVAWLTSLLIDRRVRARRSGLEKPIALFVIAAIASVVANTNRIQALGLNAEVVKTLSFFASFFILFYVIVSLVGTREQLHKIVRLLVSAGTFVAGSAVVESRTNYNIFNHLGAALPFLTFRTPAQLGLDASTLDRAGRLRVYASAEHPIELSAVLVMLVPLALYLVKSTGQRRWLAAAAILALGCFATLSRTGIVMLAVVGLVLFWLRPTDVKRFLPLLVPALCIIYVALPSTLGTFYSAFFPKGGLVADQSTTVSGNHLGADGRLADIGPSLHEWGQQPLFGEGFGSRVVSRLGTELPGVPRARLLDDQWLGSLLETGIIGVVALAWLFVRSIRRMARVSRADDGDDGWLAAALAAALFAFAVGMFTFDSLGFVHVTITFFLLLALSGVVANVHRDDPLPASPIG